MTLAAILTPEHTGTAAGASKEAVLAALSRMAATSLGLAPAAVAQAVASREALGSTGIGGGIALPHARLDGVARPTGFFLRLDRAADWAAIDGRRVDLVFMLLSPAGDDAAHLAAFAAIARRLHTPGVPDAIRAARPDVWQAIVGDGSAD